MNIKEQMNLFHSNPVIAWHEHVSGDGFSEDLYRLNEAAVDKAIEVMDLYGIDKVVTSLPVLDPHCPPEVFREANDRTYETMKRYPGRFYGEAFINPGYFRETQYELERCADLGFSGVKLYHQYYMDNPAQYPMIEKCIELDLFILMHSAKGTDFETNFMQPRLSNGVHMANIAKRYPEADFLMGHIGGGGDWKWSVKAIKDTPNVMADIGGSVHDRPMIEEAVKILGADRLVFATDGPWSSGISKVLGADISEEDKKTILAAAKFARFVERKAK